MKYALIGFLVILSYKIINNFSLLLRTLYYRKKYNTYLMNSKKGFSQYIPMVTKIFQAADLQECYFATTEPIGYGQILTSSIDHYPNLANRREDIVDATLRCFVQAKAVFINRLLEAVSPLYWIRMVIFLPQNLFSYLGLKSDSVFVKTTQVIFWIISPILIFFRDSLYQYIAGFFG